MVVVLVLISSADFASVVAAAPGAAYSSSAGAAGAGAAASTAASTAACSTTCATCPPRMLRFVPPMAAHSFLDVGDRWLFPTMGFVPRKRVLAERARLASTDSTGMARSVGSHKVREAVGQ